MDTWAHKTCTARARGQCSLQTPSVAKGRPLTLRRTLPAFIAMRPPNIRSEWYGLRRGVDGSLEGQPAA